MHQEISYDLGKKKYMSQMYFTMDIAGIFLNIMRFILPDLQI